MSNVATVGAVRAVTSGAIESVYYVGGFQGRLILRQVVLHDETGHSWALVEYYQMETVRWLARFTIPVDDVTQDFLVRHVR